MLFVSIETMYIVSVLSLILEFQVVIPLILVISIPIVVFSALLGKIKQNEYLGIVNRWTLRNEETWNATHKFG